MDEKKQNSSLSKEHDDSPKHIPYRRDRTPSIVVQSLGLSFQKDSAITGSIELPDEDEDNLSPDTSKASTNLEQQSGASSTTSGLEDISNTSGACDSGKGSSSSLQNATSPKSTSPIRFNAKAVNLGATTNRRLSLNIGSTVTRRQSLTVEGISSASFVSPTSGNATGSLRNKVALKPGYSLMGWLKLASNAKDLSGTNGRIMEVTTEELAKHDREDDCWVALKGNVYNVTTYLQYHPGGVEELMRGAGRDATELFNEVHRWVNYESILAKCLVGPYKLDSPLTPKGRSSFKTINEDSIQQSHQQDNTITNNSAVSPNRQDKSSRQYKDPTVAHKPNRRQSIALTVPSPNKYQSLLLNNNASTNLNQIQQPPTYVITQDKSCVKLKIQDLTTLSVIRSRHLICDFNERMELHVSIILSPDWLYRVHLRLDQLADRQLVTDFSTTDKTITIQLNKKEQSIWNKIGTSLDLNDSLCEMTLADKYFRPSRLLSKQQLTHDTYLFEFKLSQTLMYVPIGWHVLIREHLSTKQQNNSSEQRDFEDTRIYKNYTPVLTTLLNNDGSTDECGFMASLYFIIKIYQDGVVTGKLNQLNIGDIVDISDYQCVDFDIESLVSSSTKKHWLMLAAGTGITPFCRTISYLLSRDEEYIESVTLVFFNKTRQDIIWKDQFDKMSVKHDRFKVVHVLSDEPQDSLWVGLRGRVNKDLVAEFVDSKSPDELQILACGPRAFTQLTKSIATELNLSEKLYIFHG